jgi:hypothetical protein
MVYNKQFFSYMKPIISLLGLILFSVSLMAQVPSKPLAASKLEVLVSDGDIENDLFVLRKPAATDTVVPKVLKAAEQTFIGESALLFTYVQNYLYHTGKIKAVEPPRLAITPRQGCFGVMGFVLEQNGKRVKMPASGYVDLNRGMFSDDYNHLQSITQLFPHEMGHVIQMYLCSGTTDKEPQSVSPGIHYFNIITGYNTAFSEGFAEHFENVARKMEPSADVKAGIFRDIEQKQKELPRYINGFNRDFKLPMRIGFYRAIAPLWFQQLENLKRYQLVENGQIKYLNSTIPSENVAMPCYTGIPVCSRMLPGSGMLPRRPQPKGWFLHFSRQSYYRPWPSNTSSRTFIDLSFLIRFYLWMSGNKFRRFKTNI